MKIPSFSIKASKETLTANAGLILFGEFYEKIGFSRDIKRFLPAPGSNRGYKPDQFVYPLILMLHTGGQHLKDLRLIAKDSGLRRLTGLTRIPDAGTTGDWLKRTGENGGLFSLAQVNRRLVEYTLRHVPKNNLTLDIDATGIQAEKHKAYYTHKGFKGYMPILGHIAENGSIIGEEFREGNMAPATRNLEFIQYCADQLPEGKRFAHLRADAAAYQAEILRYCEKHDMAYAIGGKMSQTLLEEIKCIPESSWQSFIDEEGVKTSTEITTLPWTIKNRKEDFRMIILRTPRIQPDLFNQERYSYHLIATNLLGGNPQAVAHWYHKRGDHSENRIKELKQGFSMGRAPCGTIEANAAFFRIGALAYNLYILFKQEVLDNKFLRSQMKTIRLHIYHLPGKVVSTARKFILQIPEPFVACGQRIRDRIKALTGYT